MGLKIIDHSEEAMRQIEQAIRRGLEKCGQKAEGYAKMKCPVDTGLLRNSNTHVVDGENLNLSYKADTVDKNGKIQSGEYNFTAPSRDEPTVTVGTNVEYAPYVVNGHIQAGSGSYVAPNRFLEQAVTGHIAEYKSIIEEELAKLG